MGYESHLVNLMLSPKIGIKSAEVCATGGYAFA